MGPLGIILVNPPITTFQQSLTHSAVNLVIFLYWGGPVPYLELFWVGPVKKKHPVFVTSTNSGAGVKKVTNMRYAFS